MSPEDSCEICGQVHSGTKCIDNSSGIIYYKKGDNCMSNKDLHNQIRNILMNEMGLSRE
ncbi:MAG: hypothetical protein ACOCP4_00740 [Candidatus Woesearchaeota archaeon]